MHIRKFSFGLIYSSVVNNKINLFQCCQYEQCLNKESSMLCIHNNSLMLNHIFAFTLPEIQDVPKKVLFPTLMFHSR